MIPKLTEAQAETLYVLINQSCCDGGEFTAEQIFPRRDNRDNGHRRSVRALAQKGLLKQADRLLQSYTANTELCWQAWEQWRDANPDGPDNWW